MIINFADNSIATLSASETQKATATASTSYKLMAPMTAIPNAMATATFKMECKIYNLRYVGFT